MYNYLLPSLEEYFKEICFLKGKLRIVASYLPDYCNYFIKQNAEDRELISSLTTFRDLTVAPKSDNLVIPNYNYSVRLSSISAEVNNIISRESCLTVAQAYEAFESFFLQILTNYLRYNPSKLVELKLLKANLILPETEIKEILRKSSGKNNKGLISITKKISDHFKTHESKNYLSINIFHWFDILSMVRHEVVHNRQAISKGFLDYLEKNKCNKSIELFDRQFERKKIDDRVCIYLTPDKASDIITWLNSFAHYIFKSISIDARLPIGIPIFRP